MERENNDGQINDVDNCKDEIYKTVEQFFCAIMGKQVS